MANPHGSFIWYELMTPDQDASKAFYDAVMPFSIEPEPSGATDYRMLVAPDGLVGGVLKITDDMAAAGARPAWVGYIGVDDVDATVAGVKQQGGGVLLPPHDFPGVGRFAMVTDPHGAPFYVMRPTPPADDPDATSTAFAPERVGHVAWNEHSSTDHKAALGFYGALFGHENNETMAMPMGDYAFIDHHGTRIGAAHSSGEGPAHWLFYWHVPSVNETVGKITAAGGTLIIGPHEVPGGQHIVIASDPHGATFGVVGAL